MVDVTTGLANSHQLRALSDSDGCFGHRAGYLHPDAAIADDKEVEHEYSKEGFSDRYLHARLFVSF